MVLYTLLKGTAELQTVAVTPSLRDIFLPTVHGLSFKGVPVKHELRVKRLRDLARKLDSISGTIIEDAMSNLLVLMKTLYERLIETSSFNMMHHVFMVKKIGGELLFQM